MKTIPNLTYSFFNPALINAELPYSHTRIEGCAVPEYMLALTHGKRSRIVLGMITKYTLLLPLLKSNSKILDPCAGSGFGSNLLGTSGHEVTYLDTKLVFKDYRTNVTKFFDKDLLDNPDLGAFDAITFIDAIEHFYPAEQNKIISYFYNSLTPNGYLLIDTPLTGETGEKNKFHKNELNWIDFYALLKTCPWTKLRRFIIKYFDYKSEIYPMLMELPEDLKDIRSVSEVGGTTDQLILVLK